MATSTNSTATGAATASAANTASGPVGGKKPQMKKIDAGYYFRNIDPQQV